MKFCIAIAALALGLVACSSSPPKPDGAMLEKYPQCQHMNVKIANKCIQKNEAGDKVTAVELENNAYPGQYQ